MFTGYLVEVLRNQSEDCDVSVVQKCDDRLKCAPIQKRYLLKNLLLVFRFNISV